MSTVATRSEELRKYKFAQYIMLIGNFLLPALAFLDFKAGFLVPMISKIGAWFISIYGSYYSFYIRQGDKRINYLLAFTLLVFPIIGIVYKGYNVLGVMWSPVLPFLYMYLANLRWGLTFSLFLWAVQLIAYWFVPYYLHHDPYPLNEYLMINVIYAVALILAIVYEYLNSMQAQQLKSLATVDLLTQLDNRYGFHKILQSEYKRVQRRPADLSLIQVGLDNFKSINDNFGHNSGDQVLREVGSLLKQWVRETDFVGRWAGDEFIILLPETSLQQAGAVGEKLCRRLASQPVYEIGRVTGSFGVTQLKQEETIEAFSERADHLMRRAKLIKKNCVVMSMDN